MDVKQAIRDVAQAVINELQQNPEFRHGMEAGAGITFLVGTKAGRALIRAAVTKVIPIIAKYTVAASRITAKLVTEVAKEMAAAAGVYIPKDAVTGQAAQITKSANSPVSDKFNDLVNKSDKAFKGTLIGTACVLSGAMIGEYYGNTISWFKGYKKSKWGVLEGITRVIAPAIYTVTDTVEAVKNKFDEAKVIDKNTLIGSAKELTSKTGKGVKYSQTARDKAPIVSKEESGRQVVEYERNKEKGNQIPLKTTSDKMVEFMQKKATKAGGFNSPDWYMRGLAKYLVATNLTWTGLKSYLNESIKFALTAAIDVSLLPPIEDMKLHPQVVSNNRILFQALRGKNTGAYTYNEEDVYHYTMALTSFIARWRYIAKLISIVNTYDVQVRDLPTRMYCAIFLPTNGKTNHDAVIANKPSLTEQMNSLAKDLNTWGLHGTTFISRWNYIADKALRDYQGPKPVYGVYSITKMIAYDANGAKVYEFDKQKSVQDYINELRSDYEGWATLPNNLRIAGDMMKLLGANKATFSNVPLLSGKESVVYEYDPEAIDQLRSAKFFNIKQNAVTLPSYDGVTPANYQMDLTTTATTLYADRLLELTLNDWTIITDRNKEFSISENLQLIQFCYTAKRTDSGAAYANSQVWKLDNCTGTILEDMSIRYTETINADGNITLFGGIFGLEPAKPLYVNGADTSLIYEEIGVLKEIDFLPSLQLYNLNSADAIVPRSQFVDVDSYAQMSAEQFKQMNNVAVYSLTYAFSPEDLKIMGLIS